MKTAKGDPRNYQSSRGETIINALSFVRSEDNLLVSSLSKRKITSVSGEREKEEMKSRFVRSTQILFILSRKEKIYYPRLITMFDARCRCHLPARARVD